MTLGKPGIKYGLHRPNAAAKAKPVASIFGDDEDDSAIVDPGKALMSDKHREKMQKRAEKEMAKALAVDASIFDYDGAHDEIVAEREKQDVAKASSSSQVLWVDTPMPSSLFWFSARLNISSHPLLIVSDTRKMAVLRPALSMWF